MQDRIDQIALTGTGERDEGYSAFEATNIDLESYLRKRGVDTLYIAGIAAEYCVKETALDAIKRGFRTYVIQDAVAGIRLHEGDVERAFREMEDRGVTAVDAAEILHEGKE
jgi:nicotinamidase/pyrazinamidase